MAFTGTVTPTAPLESLPMRDPLDMTAAELRCLREDLSMTVKDLAAALEVTRNTISRWETTKERDRQAQRISKANAERFTHLVEFTDRAVEQIRAAAGDTILTYVTDAEFQQIEAYEDWTLPASWHRMVAWRAAQAIPGAVIRYRGHD